MSTQVIDLETPREHELILPPVETCLKLPSTMSFYGADRVLHKHCRLKTGKVREKFSWQHGWCSRQRQAIDPVLLVNEPTIDPAKTFLVARDDEQAYLKSHGLKSHAIGLPFAYAQPLKVTRIPNSLLVMPAHSLDFTQHQWKFEDYVDQIAEIADQFDRVVVCVHASCARKGYWLPHFERHGIECVIGADAFDVNGLLRIKTLMHQFEFMTTNVIGSHLAYAAVSGNRISIFGEYAEMKAVDFEQSEFYMANPHVLEPILKLHTREYAEATYPQFFLPPDEAESHLQWGQSEIGQQNVLSPSEMKKLMGWDWVSRARRKTRRIKRTLCRPSERFVKNLLRPAAKKSA